MKFKKKIHIIIGLKLITIFHQFFSVEELKIQYSFLSNKNLIQRIPILNKTTSKSTLLLRRNNKFESIENNKNESNVFLKQKHIQNSLIFNNKNIYEKHNNEKNFI